MEKINHHDNLEKIYNLNKHNLEKLKYILESMDKIESNIEKKIDIHRKYIENLQQNFKQLIDSYHNICKNLVLIN